jgi:hypothetical protein
LQETSWLQKLRDAQVKAIAGVAAFHDFQFTDRLSASGITFRHRIVDDAGKAYKAAHYDHGNGLAIADVDGDGRTDLYFVNQVGGNQLWRNAGGGRFEDITAPAGIAVPGKVSVSAGFADIDNDGDVDLFVANYVDPDPAKICGDARARAYCRPDVYSGVPSVLYRNNGNGTFTDVTKASGLDRSDGKALGVVFADYDGDGWIDLFVANDLTRNFLFHNEGKGVFKEVGLPAGVAVASDGRVRAGMGTDFGDYDGDGKLDLVVTNFESETHSLFRNLGGGLFADATVETGLGPATLPFLGFGVAFLDYDNDTDLDLAIANGHVLDNADLFRSTSRYAQRNLLLRNEGEGPLRRGRPALQPWIAHGEGQSDHRRRGYRQRRRP